MPYGKGTYGKSHKGKMGGGTRKGAPCGPSTKGKSISKTSKGTPQKVARKRSALDRLDYT